MSQHGTIHRRQALGCGMTSAEIDARLASRAWERVHDQVYAVAGVPLTHELRCWAASIAVRFGTQDAARQRQVAVGGLNAAALLKLTGRKAPTRVELVVPIGAAVPRLRGVRIRRLSCWADVGVVRIGGLLVTSRSDTIARLAALVSDDELLTVAQQELFHRRVSLPALAGRRRRGRDGSARLGRVVETLANRIDSTLHLRGRRVLVQAGMPTPQCGLTLVPGTGETDCVVFRKGATGPPWGYVVEWDGAVHWISRRKYRFGIWKRKRLRRTGFVVFPGTSDDVDDPAALTAEVLAEDRRQSALPPEGDGRYDHPDAHRWRGVA